MSVSTEIAVLNAKLKARDALLLSLVSSVLGRDAADTTEQSLADWDAEIDARAAGK